MDDHLETVWMKVINCAISNSVDYKLPVPAVTSCSTELLEKCVIRFIVKNKNCSADEAKSLYTGCLGNALTKKHADGYRPAWVTLGLVLGIGLGIIELVSLIIFGFTWPFVLFLLIAGSLVKISLNHISAEKTVRMAAKVWRESLKESNEDKMEAALEKMQEIILSDAAKLKVRLEF